MAWYSSQKRLATLGCSGDVKKFVFLTGTLVSATN